ncbi:MAG: hypothetical protein ACR2MB_04445 [Acidimicrobiales bacterium]
MVVVGLGTAVVVVGAGVVVGASLVVVVASEVVVVLSESNSSFVVVPGPQAPGRNTVIRMRRAAVLLRAE